MSHLKLKVYYCYYCYSLFSVDHYKIISYTNGDMKEKIMYSSHVAPHLYEFLSSVVHERRS